MSSLIKVEQLNAVNFFDLSPSFNNAIHNHKDWEFIYVDSGEVTCLFENEKRYLKSGDVMFHKPWQTHSTVCNGKNSASIFNVQFVSVSPLMEYFEGKKLTVSQSTASILKRLMEESNSTYEVSAHPLTLRESTIFGGEQMCRLILEEFLILLIRDAEETTTPVRVSLSQAVPPQIEEICDFLRTRIYGKVTLNDISEKFHFGKSFLCEQFKKAKGISPINYYLELKLTEAKRLLRENDLNITEIAEKLGFENPEYFSRYFKKRVGHSPRDFRNMLINDATLRKI